MTSPASRLALGTVQFGLDYGATNQAGQVLRDGAQSILEAARDAGIGVIDTAAAYGNAEELLGSLIDIVRGMRIVTKTLPCAADGAIVRDDIAAVDAAFARSQSLLGVDRIDTLLVHHGANLLQNGGELLLAWLRRVQGKGEVGRIGVSVYEPDELEAILALFVPEVVQLPCNILDQRFRQRGMLDRLAGLGVEIHVRSLFLQGTLLAGPENLPAHLSQLRPPVMAAGEAARRCGLSMLEACLAFGLSQPEIGKLVVGVTSVGELEEILTSMRKFAARPISDFQHLAVTDPDVILPSRWPRRAAT